MADRQHGESLPAHHPTGTRGNHTVEGFNAVANEAARGAIVQVASDRGRVVYQSGGTSPGWYLADGAGGWTQVGGGGGVDNLQEAYTGGGTIDAVVAGSSNVLGVRAADLTSDVLLRIRRNATGAAGEQSLLKSPDAIATGVDGTQLIVRSGQGLAGTGATAGSHAGALVSASGDGGASVNGQAGSGGPVTNAAGAGGAASGSGDGGSGGSASLTGGTGGAAATTGEAGAGGALSLRAGTGAVAGAGGTAGSGGQALLQGGDGNVGSVTNGDGAHGGSLALLGGTGGDATGTGQAGSSGGVRIDSGTIGAGEEEDGSLNGSPGNINIGDVNALLILIGQGSSGGVVHLRAVVSVGVDVDPGSRLALDIPRSGGGSGPPKGALGLPTYTTTERDALVSPGPATGAKIWNSTNTRSEVYNGTAWIPEVQDAPLAVTFGSTPTFDLSASQDFALGQITSNFAMTLSNPAVGQRGRIFMVQDGTGSRLITGITVTGFTVLMDMEAETSVNTTQYKVASARSVLEYKLATINAVNVCLVRVRGAKTAAFG